MPSTNNNNPSSSNKQQQQQQQPPPASASASTTATTDAAPAAAPAPASAASAASAPPTAHPATTTASTTTKTTTTKKKKTTARKAGATKAKTSKKTGGGTGGGGTGGGTGTTTKRKKASQRNKKSGQKDPALTAESIYETAKLAQQDLARQRTQAAAKKSDPLWYRIEDCVLPSSSSSTDTNSTILPDQIQIVERALALSGLNRTHVTPQAMACLLEQARKYASTLLSSAQELAYISGRSNSSSDIMITRDDMDLAKEFATQNNFAHSIMSQLPKLQMVSQQQVNRAPLPSIPSQSYSGILLPVEKQHQVTSRTFDVVVSQTTQAKMQMKPPTIPESPLQRASNKNSKQKQKQSSAAIGYGASRGRTQIPIHLDNKKKNKNNKKGGSGGDAMDTTA